MQRSKHILAALFVSVALLSILTGCSRDPKVRREKFLTGGERSFEKGDYQTASIQFRRAIQIDPRFAEAHYRLALTDLRLRQWQDAYRSLQKSLETDPNYVPARLELASLEFAARQTARARQDIELALAKEPSNLQAHLLLGQIALSEKDYDRALREFETAQQIAPKNPTPWVQGADTYVLMRKYPEAQQAFQRAIDVDASYISAYLDFAQAYRLQGDSRSELGVLQEAIQRNPKQAAPYLAVGAAYVRLGQSGQLPTLFSSLRSAAGDDPTVLLAIGEFYFATGDAPRAKANLNDALAKDKKNKIIRKRLIELELNQHEWDQAESLNGELLKADPKDPEARLFQARLQFVREAKAQAITTLEQLVHDSPEMALPRFYLGLAYANQGEAARAKTALNDTLRQDPNFIWAYVGLAELHAQQGNPKLALEFANQALAHNPSFVPAILLQSNAYMQLGDFGTAVAKLQALAALQPKNTAVLERLAVAAINQKQYAAAEQRLEQALQLQPEYVPAMMDLVQLYGMEKRTIDQIIGRVQQQIERSPEQSSFYEIMGDAYVAKGDSGKARQAFENALKLNSDATGARVQVARLDASEGKLPEAIQNVQKLLENHPDFLAGYLLLGSFYERTDDIAKAEQAYQDALQRNGDFAPALNNLAWLYCENGGNLDMALTFAQRAKAKLPTEPSVSDTLAWIQYRKGLYTSASVLLRDATRQSPQNATYQYHLGMALWKSGKPVEAKATLQRALELKLVASSAQEAKNVLAQLDGKAL